MWAAIRANGMAVAAATGDDEALRICNSAIARGAISAGVTGSGPAIAIICYEQHADSLAEFVRESEMEVIVAAFTQSRMQSEEASRWE